jgi:hypothetical protein
MPFLECGGLPPLCFDIDLSMSLEGKSWHRQVDAKKKRRQAAALQKGRQPDMATGALTGFSKRFFH